MNNEYAWIYFFDAPYLVCGSILWAPYLSPYSRSIEFHQNVWVLKHILLLKRSVCSEEVPESSWKHHKSKELEFLHRSCTSFFFWINSEKIFFEARTKKSLDFFWRKKNREISKISISQNFQILIFQKILRNPTFGDFFVKILKIFLKKKFRSRKKIFWTSNFFFDPKYTLWGYFNMYSDGVGP